MTRRDWFIAALVHLYPEAWRHEYGAELEEMLTLRPLTAGVVADVVWNGVCLRWRYPTAAEQLSFFVTTWVALDVATNVIFPATWGCGVLQDSSMTLPAVILAPGGTAFWTLVLVACGFCTRWRERTPVWRSGTAAMRLGLNAGLPVMLLGLLLLAGVLDLRAVVDLRLVPRAQAVAQARALLASHDWAYTYCSTNGRVPSPLAILAAPLLRLPLAFVYGLFGGGLAAVWQRLWAAIVR